MSFAHPGLLLFLLLVPAGALLAARAERRRRTALARFGELGLLESFSRIADTRRRWLRYALRLGALTCLLIAAARPQIGERPALIARAGRDVLLLLDLSRSMNVADADGTRLARAKQLAATIATAHPSDRFGLIVFGGSAFLQLPLTSDHDAFRRFVDAGSTEDIGDPSTDLSAALAAAGATFEHDGEPGSRAVLILSDGESGEGDIASGVRALVKEGAPVFAVGVGSLPGGPVPADSSEAPEPYHRDHIGRIVVSRLEEADLRQSAERTGGAYARWDDAAGMGALNDALGRLATRVAPAHRGLKPAERYQWPLGAAVLLLLAEPLVPLATRRRRTPDAPAVGSRARAAAAAALLIVSLMPLGCSPAGWPARRAERRYDAGDWPGAYNEWARARQLSGDQTFVFDQGNALYRQKHYRQATDHWREIAGNQRLRQRTVYNLGNAAMRAAEDATGAEKDSLLDGAVTAFEQAVQLDPTDTDAKWNLEIALRRRGQRPGGSSSGRSRRGDYGQGNQNVPGFEGNPEAAAGAMAGGGFGSGADGESVKELDPTEARQLLDAVQREQLASHLGRRASHPTHASKDW